MRKSRELTIQRMSAAFFRLNSEIKYYPGGLVKKIKTPFALTHCTSIYPCPPKLSNIRAIPLMVEKFKYSASQVTLLFLINYLFNWVFAEKIGKIIHIFGEKKSLTFEYVGLIIVFVSYALVTNACRLIQYVSNLVTKSPGSSIFTVFSFLGGSIFFVGGYSDGP